MSMSASDKRKRRDNLMKRDPHCYWCKRPLVKNYQKGGKLPDNFPTLDHLNDRILVSKRPVIHNAETIVLSCPPCNYGRASARQLQYALFAMWRSGSFPKPFSWVGTTLKFLRGHPRIGQK